MTLLQNDNINFCINNGALYVNDQDDNVVNNAFYSYTNGGLGKDTISNLGFNNINENYESIDGLIEGGNSGTIIATNITKNKAIIFFILIFLSRN